MTIPVLIEVQSSRFKAWAYVAEAAELWVRYPPTKNGPSKVYAYSSVAPEQWDDAQEAESKGQWLGNEILKRPDRHPYRLIPEVIGQDDGTPRTDTFYGGVPEVKKIEEPQPDLNSIPEPIRAIATLPPAPVIILPDILPPDAKDGEPKPFKQVVTERATAIAAALPANLTVNTAESYRALATALVTIRSERIATEKALALIIQPAVDWKRDYDAWRNQVVTLYSEAEKRLDNALQGFKRAEDARVQAEETRLRKEAAAKAQREAEAAAEIERQRRQKEAEEMEAAAKARIQEAQETLQAVEASQASDSSPDGLFGATGADLAASVTAEAEEEIQRAEADIKEAQAMAAAPVEVGQVYTPPVSVAKPDLKVTGMRAKPPAWKWRLKTGIANKPLAENQPISRLDLRNPDVFPAEYWILDQDALSATVRNMKGRTSIEAIETYNANA
jgi:hypothetical protein